MSLPRAALLVACAALLTPQAASGAVRVVARGEPVAAGRAPAASASSRILPARLAPIRFHLVGLHWRGAGDVAFRTALEHGRWSSWRRARPEGEDLPDPGTAEARPRRGWKLGNPHWTGPARWIQYRLTGRVSRLRAHFVASPTTPFRRPAIAPAPGIIRRSGWGANEAIVRAGPAYAAAVRFAIVHHTAGSSPSSPAESAAIVRAIQAYHVRANGWNDIGYNFLVDAFGQVFEGRRGGVARNVIGAHAQGFNTGSVGVAVLGTYGSAPPSAAAEQALADLLAWRLDVAHADPLARLTQVSVGNARFPAGTRVSLAGVSGHRDTGFTSCPGTALYGRLGAVAEAAAARGLPKLYDPVASGALGGPVRFQARLSTALPWAVTVTDSAGAAIAAGTGSGDRVDWTWDAAGAEPDHYRWRIEAGPDVRPARGSFGTPLAVTGARARPRVLTPNGDGVGEHTVVSFSLSLAASVTITAVDASGAEVGTLVHERPFAAGAQRLRWNGSFADGSPLPDGRYTLGVEARVGTTGAAASARLVVDRTLGALAVTPVAFSPNGDGRNDVLAVAFDLARSARLRARVLSGRRAVATVLDGRLAGGRVALAWDGQTPAGRLADGRYRLAVAATTRLGTRKLARPFTLDTRRPRVRILSASSARGRTRLRFALSEDARLEVALDSRRFTITRRAGIRRFSRRLVAARARIAAWDAAGNASKVRRARITARAG